MSSIHEKISAAILTMIRARRKAASASEGEPPRSLIAPPPARLREAQFSDFEAVARLKQRWGLNADSFENWERLWRRNPAVPQSGGQRPIGWVLEADGAVVGYLGNICLLYRFKGRMLTAVTAHGFVVDSPYRAVGLSLAAAFFRQKDVDLFVSTSAIEAVGKIAVAFKSAPLPQPDYDTVLFWVLQPYPFARVLMKKLNFSAPWSQIASALTSLLVGTDKILRRRWPARSVTPFILSEIGVHEIGDDFNTLWNAKLNEDKLGQENLSEENLGRENLADEERNQSSRLFADRSAATLRWHFEIPGDLGCARVLCCYLDRELVGYAVIRTDTNQENGLQTSMIADMLARQDDPQIVQALWKAAYDYARREGSHVLEVLGFPPGIRKVGSAWNPHRRKYPACPFYYKAADPALHQALADGTAWYASPFDGDATLIRPSYPASRSGSTLHSASTVPIPLESAAGSFPVVSEPEHSQVF